VGFVYRPDGGSTATSTNYTVAAGQTQWDILGIKNADNQPVKTTVWGYGNSDGGVALPYTFPGRTFEVQRNSAIRVKWLNRLMEARVALPHLLPVDQTISLQKVTTGVPTAVHHHGSDSAFEFDGGPDQWQTPLRQQKGPGVNAVNGTGDDGVSYTYDNAQEASLHWYHDHAEGVTRTNVYAGLAGLYVIRDRNEAQLQTANVLPSGPYEVALLLQDKTFTADASLSYTADPAQYPDPEALGSGIALPLDNPTHMPEMFGDVIVVNGKAWPTLAVEPRPYRLRLLNGADARVFQLDFGAARVWQIGTDLGFLNNPVAMSAVTIAPGERMDLIVDFSACTGQQIVVGNSAAAPFPFGDPVLPGSGADVVMRFSVTRARNVQVPAAPVSANTRLRGVMSQTLALTTPARVPGSPKVRRILLGEGVDEYGRILPLLGTYDPTGVANNGTMDFNEPPTEFPSVGSTEIWEFWNTTEDAHPVHMHLVQFRILNRENFTGTTGTTVMPQGWTGVRLEPGAQLDGAPVVAPAHEQGLKDTVVCPPGMVTRVAAAFNRRGKYVYHCHILSHEEHSMMRWFIVS
jgi:spore coat protein A